MGFTLKERFVIREIPLPKIKLDQEVDEECNHNDLQEEYNQQLNKAFYQNWTEWNTERSTASVEQDFAISTEPAIEQ